MKKLLLLLTLGSAALSAAAQGTLQVVLPTGFENVDGNTALSGLFRSDASTFQQVYSWYSYGFTDGATQRIDGMAFRFNANSAQGFTGVWSSLTVSLSTIPRQFIVSLSSNYVNNRGPDEVMVYSDSLQIIAEYSEGVRPFQVIIPFSTPFFYNPSQGDLSVLMTSSAGPVSLLLDAQLSGALGSVIGDLSPRGSVDNIGLVTRFSITPVPEPSTWALGLAGLATLALGSRRRKRVR